MPLYKNMQLYGDVLTPILFILLLLWITYLPLSLIKMDIIHFHNIYNFRAITTIVYLVLIVVFIFVIGINLKIRKMFKKN